MTDTIATTEPIEVRGETTTLNIPTNNVKVQATGSDSPFVKPARVLGVPSTQPIADLSAEAAIGDDNAAVDTLTPEAVNVAETGTEASITASVELPSTRRRATRPNAVGEGLPDATISGSGTVGA